MSNSPNFQKALNHKKQECKRLKAQLKHWKQCFAELEHHDDVEIIGLKREIYRLKSELKPNKISCYAQKVNSNRVFISTDDYTRLPRDCRYLWKQWSTTPNCFYQNQLHLFNKGG
jgi:cell shape-determining protein MreC